MRPLGIGLKGHLIVTLIPLRAIVKHKMSLATSQVNYRKKKLTSMSTEVTVILVQYLQCGHIGGGLHDLGLGHGLYAQESSVDLLHSPI